MFLHELPVIPLGLSAVVLVESGLVILLGRWYVLFPVTSSLSDLLIGRGRKHAYPSVVPSPVPHSHLPSTFLQGHRCDRRLTMGGLVVGHVSRTPMRNPEQTPRIRVSSDASLI